MKNFTKEIEWGERRVAVGKHPVEGYLIHLEREVDPTNTLPLPATIEQDGKWKLTFALTEEAAINLTHLLIDTIK